MAQHHSLQENLQLSRLVSHIIKRCSELSPEDLYLHHIIFVVGQWGPAIALIGLCYVPAGDVALAVGLLTIVVGLNAGHYTGFLVRILCT